MLFAFFLYDYRTFTGSVNGNALNAVNNNFDAPLSALASGALWYDRQNTLNGVFQGGNTSNSIGLDASRSNSVYTDSGKVYPLSLALNFIIKC